MTKTTGKQLISAAWAGLKQDKELMILPILGSFFCTLAVAVIAGVGFIAGAFDSILTENASASNLSPLGIIFSVLIAYVSTTIALYFQAALIFGAMKRLDGGDPTVGSSLRAANSKLGAIMFWSLIATTVGLILRAISERGGALAKFASAIAGMAWAVATFFVLPVVIFEGINSFAAVKRSGQLLKEKWGAVARTSLRFGLKLFLAILVTLGAIVVGFVMAATSADSGQGPSPLVGLAIATLGIIGLVVVTVVTNALTGYVRAVLYRHAVGLPIPGISEEVLVGAFPIKN